MAHIIAQLERLRKIKAFNDEATRDLNYLEAQLAKNLISKADIIRYKRAIIFAQAEYQNALNAAERIFRFFEFADETRVVVSSAAQDIQIKRNLNEVLSSLVIQARQRLSEATAFAHYAYAMFSPPAAG